MKRQPQDEKLRAANRRVIVILVMVALAVYASSFFMLTD